MNIDKIAPIAAIAISLIALFVPFEYWGLLLVAIGLVHGVMSPVDDRAAQAMIYVGITYVRGAIYVYAYMLCIRIITYAYIRIYYTCIYRILCAVWLKRQ